MTKAGKEKPSGRGPNRTGGRSHKSAEKRALTDENLASASGGQTSAPSPRPLSTDKYGRIKVR
jgi:hypothetical protein